jgi:hypothetical protein
MIRSPQRQLAPDAVGPGIDETTSLRGIADKARHDKEHRFGNLYGELNEALLKEAWRGEQVRGQRNRPGHGPVVAPEKTRLLRFSRFHVGMRRRFAFLGFEFYWSVDRQASGV